MSGVLQIAIFLTSAKDVIFLFKQNNILVSKFPSQAVRRSWRHQRRGIIVIAGQYVSLRNVGIFYLRGRWWFCLVCLVLIFFIWVINIWTIQAKHTYFPNYFKVNHVLLGLTVRIRKIQESFRETKLVKACSLATFVVGFDDRILKKSLFFHGNLIFLTYWSYTVIDIPNRVYYC